MTKTTLSKSTESTHSSKEKESTTMRATKTMKAVKLATIDHLKASAFHPNQSSSPTAMAALSVADSDDKDADILIKKKCRRGDGSTDVLTVFEHVNPDDNGEGYEFQICM